jgi:hypothetical protein
MSIKTKSLAGSETYYIVIQVCKLKYNKLHYQIMTDKIIADIPIAIHRPYGYAGEIGDGYLEKIIIALEERSYETSTYNENN